MNTTTKTRETKETPAPASIIPMEIAVAISTERTQFVDMLEKRISAPGATPLTGEELRGMLQIIREFIDDRLAMKGKLRRLQDMVRALESLSKGYTKKLRELDAVLEGTDLVPDDDE